MKILEEKNNALFNRKEVIFETESDSSPSNEEIKKIISEEFSSNPENIVIKKIGSKFGSNTFTVSALIYKNKEEKDRVEPKSKKVAQK